MIVRFIIDLHLQKLFFHTFSNNFQATRCSFSGKLASDPESTVHISGCPEEETFDIVLMSKKVKWSSQTYFVIVLNYIFLQNLMIFLQTNLQFNSYRVDNAGKTIVWIIVSHCMIQARSKLIKTQPLLMDTCMHMRYLFWQFFILTPVCR